MMVTLLVSLASNFPQAFGLNFDCHFQLACGVLFVGTVLFMSDAVVLISGFILVNHRVSTHYGERHARLSRDQAILVDDAQESRHVAFLTSLLSFQASAGYQARLNDIFIDHLVYAHQWKPFMSACLRDWKATSKMVRVLSI